MSVTYPRGIGLLGGTFDPIHNGHLALAREALRTLRLQRIELLVASAPWQKNVLTPVDLRVRMAEDALAREAHMRVNLTEVLRDGATYTIDTLKVLRDKLGPSEPLVLIIGCDQWANFHTWKHWRDFTDYCSVAVCRRGGENAEAVAEVLRWAEHKEVAPELIRNYACGKITRFSMVPHLANSSAIRATFARFPRTEALKRLQHWLPAPVAVTIAQKKIS